MSYCFCVLGWHYFERFYERLYEIPGDKFVIGHREPEPVAGERVAGLIANDLRLHPNRGLDFGGYHQFNEVVDLNAYDFVIYCHDDLVIKDAGFVDAISERFRGDPALMVIGNGYNGADSEFRFGKYKKRMFWDEDDDFLVRTVRGSFFAARPEVFAKIGNFPVEWKADAERMRKGNVSLRNFAYRVTKAFGIESIAYLDETRWLETRYIIELRRGVRHPATAPGGAP
ncbi:MAG: hypothetical protein IIC89_06845 [Chloroflexi bacterium]|nr:hypothetical protein [Chloroflexota bacterium]